MQDVHATARPGASPLGRLASRGAIYTAGMVLARLCSLMLVPLYTHRLGPADYGVMELLDTADLVVVVVFSAALTDPLLRFFHQAPDARAQARVVSSVTLALLGVGTVVALLGMGVAPWASTLIFHGPGRAGLLRLTFAAVTFQAVLEVPYALLRGTDRPMAYVAAVLARVALGLGLNVVFLVYLHLGVQGMVLSQLASSLLASSVLITLTLRRYGMAFDPGVVRAMVRFGWPLIPGSLALIGLQHTRAYVLNAYCTLTDVGLWSVGFKFAVTVTVALGQPLRSAWSAQMYSVWAGPDGRRTYIRAGTLLLAVLLGGATGIAALSREIVTVVAAPAYARAAMVIPPVAFAFALRELADYFRNGLFVGGDTRAVAYIEPAVALLDLAVGVVFVRRWGLPGAVAAAPLVFACYALAMHQASRRVLSVRYEYGRMATVAALALGLTGLCLSLDTHRLVPNVALKLSLVALYPVAVVLLVFRAPDERAALRALRRRALGW